MVEANKLGKVKNVVSFIIWSSQVSFLALLYMPNYSVSSNCSFLVHTVSLSHFYFI